MDMNTNMAAPGPLESCLQNALHELALDVMVVDVQARLVYANRSARAELDLGDTLMLHEGHLRCSSVHQHDTLAQALQAATHGRRSMFELGSGAAARMHAVIPLPATPTEAAPIALLLAGARQPFGPVTLTLFAKAAGLTASERDVLIALCSGLAVTDIARQREVCISTIRTQVSSIREKFGVRTLTEVIRKVSGLPPMSMV